MRKLTCLLCLLNTINIFGQCSVTFIGDPDYCGLCVGTLTASPTGQSPFSYLWSTGYTTQTISGLCAGVYSLTVTDSNSCSVTQGVIVSGSSFSASVTGTDATCNGCCDGTEDVITSGGFPPYTYLWSCSGQTTSSVTGLCAGNCFVQITDGMGCSYILPFTTNEPPTGITTNNISSAILLYPNPTNQNATLEFNNFKRKNCTLALYDSRGNLVQTINNITTDKVEIERKNLTHGLYFFQLRTDNQVVGTGKLTIE